MKIKNIVCLKLNNYLSHSNKSFLSNPPVKKGGYFFSKLQKCYSFNVAYKEQTN